MDSLSRRNFMKIAGIAAVAPTALLKAKPLYKKFGTTSKVLDGSESDIFDGDWTIDLGPISYDTIYKITAQKCIPEITGFHFQAEGMTFEDCKARFDRTREYLKRISQIEFEIGNIGDIVVNDIFNLETPNKRMCGEYRIIKIEERPRGENET